MYVGCDTGGTFTDFVWYDPTRPQLGLKTLKLSSTPCDPSEAVLNGIAFLCGGERPVRVNHATTVATNALLEKTGGKVAFVTSEGFADLLWLGRGQRTELYSRTPGRVDPPLLREHSFEIAERVLASGEILRELTSSALEKLLQELPQDLDSLAICLLHSSRNPSHEIAIAKALGKRISSVFCSHQVAPGSGEFERAMTTVIAAYLASKIEDYLALLADKLGREVLQIVHSAGGLLTIDEARAAPHRLTLSGPAAGLRGALSVGLSCDRLNLVTLDMGGTSSDVALLAEGRLPYSWHTTVEGLPLWAPTLDIHTVGAGGGSIAYLDSAEILRVGPRSAGARPGPACYDLGGMEATVTDALCWSGLLPKTIGSDHLPLKKEAAERVLERLGNQLHLSVSDTAIGILEVAAAHLAEAVRKVTTGRGLEPGSFTLFPFGGAGPLLCCRVAELLLMDTILLPHCAGVLSAWGALTAPWEREWSRSVPPTKRGDPTYYWELCRELQQTAGAELDTTEQLEWTQLVARRYKGQGETLVSKPQADFHTLHLKQFGFQRPQVEVEVLEVRVRAQRPALQIPGEVLPHLSAPTARETQRVQWQGKTWTVPVYRHITEIEADSPGPFLYFQAAATLFVPPHWRAHPTVGSHLLLSRCVSS